MSEPRKTRILFISLRSDYGGGPKHMYDLIAGLDSFFEKYVACPVQKPFCNMYKEKGIKVFPLPVRAFSIVSLVALVGFAKRNYIDIIHSHGKAAGVYSRALGALTNKPVVHTLHGIHYYNYSCVVQKIYFIIERIMSGFTRNIINVSEAEHKEGLRLRLFPKSRARVIYNGVDIDALSESTVDVKLQNVISNVKKNNILICTVARFDYVKGIDVAIQAMKYLKEYCKDFKYYLIGDGELKGEILEKIKECRLDDQILLLGFRDDVSGILRMMDIYLSSSRVESMSLTLLEAMSSGLPVVATDIPGNRELVMSGLLARPEDPHDIARKINMLIKNPRLRNNLSREGRNAVGKYYTLEKMIRTTENLYHKLLQSKELFPSTLNVRKGGNIRIGINALKYYDVNTGVGRYTFNLCRSIVRAGSKNDYCLYTPSGIDSYVGMGRENVHSKKTCEVPKHSTLRILWEQIALPIYSAQDRLNLFHYTDHALSLFQRVRPVIITVHDIAYVRNPGLLNKSRQIYKKYILNTSIKRADVIIADSHSTKRDIMEFFKVKEENIKVVHLGVESRFYPISNVEEYRLRNNLPSKMILNVGTLEPRKNVVALIKAFKKLREKGFKDYKLVIAGDKGWLYKRIFDEVKSNDLQQEVLFLGIVEDEDLPMLYNCADIFVYPSLYEGFGLPPLEAMACGIPVITSNTSSLPEVIGDAGIMVDPTDVNSLCENMYVLLKDRELWNRMSNIGRERSKMFSWEETAKKILEIYEEVLAKTHY